MNTKPILVALEYEKDSSAVLQRARLAAGQQQPGQAELCLFVADYSDALERTYLFDQQALEQARNGFVGARRKWLEKHARLLETEGFRVSVNARWGKPRYVALLEEAQRVRASLILKTTHPHGTLGRTFLAPGDWYLIRETPVPLWLVKDRHWAEPLRLAASVDPVHENEDGPGRDHRLLTHARALSAGLPAELHVIHAYEPMPTGLIAEFDALLVQSDTVRSQAQQRHRQALDRLLDKELDGPARRHFEEGAPARVIPEVVRRERIDLVVMGAVARSGLERFLIGSTAEQVLDAIEADLLIIK